MNQARHQLAAYLRAPFAPENRFATGLLILVALRVLSVIMLLLDVPHIYGHAGVWYFQAGGDQHDYFRLASALARGQIAPERVSLGASLVMVPLVWLVNPSEYREIVAPLVILNGVILGGASVALTGLVGKTYTGDRRVGLLSAALWMLLPVFVYLAVGLHFAADLLRGTLLPKIMWLTGISDGPASFGILLGIWALGFGFERGSLRAFFLAGLGFGWAVMARIQTAPVVGFVLGVLLLMRNWRGLLWVCVGGWLGFLPQAVLNIVEFGIPFYSSYLRVVEAGNPNPAARWSLDQILSGLPFSPGQLLAGAAYYWERFPWLIWPVLLVGAVGLLTVTTLWRRRGWSQALILFGVVVVHIGVHATTWIIRDDPVRHTMLVYPYLLVIGAYTFFLLWDEQPRVVARWRGIVALLSRNAGAGRS